MTKQNQSETPANMMPARIWAHKFTGEHNSGRWLTANMFSGTEYIRADVSESRVEALTELVGQREGWMIAARQAEQERDTAIQAADAATIVSMSLRQELGRLRGALEFYANPNTYKPDSTGRTDDLTWKARAALESTQASEASHG